jgi:hypothetical protein
MLYATRSDLLKALPLSPEVTDVFLRTLNILDEEVVLQDQQRTPEQVENYMKVKDAMRETVITDLVDTMYHLLVSYAAPFPRLASRALYALAALIDWIDLGLVLNDRFVPLFFNFLTHANLQIGALNCIYEVCFRMFCVVVVGSFARSSMCLCVCVCVCVWELD